MARPPQGIIPNLPVLSTGHSDRERRPHQLQRVSELRGGEVGFQVVFDLDGGEDAHMAQDRAEVSTGPFPAGGFHQEGLEVGFRGANSLSSPCAVANSSRLR